MPDRRTPRGEQHVHERTGPAISRLSPKFVRRQFLEPDPAPDDLPDDAHLLGLTQRRGAGEDVALDGVDLRSSVPDGLRVAAAHEQLCTIGQRFEKDDEVGLVLEGLASGMKGPEIQDDLGITATEYETIMTRLRRGVDRKEGWRP